MEQTHIKSFGLRLVLARHVITQRDLLSFGARPAPVVGSGLHSLAVSLPFCL